GGRTAATGRLRWRGSGSGRGIEDSLVGMTVAARRGSAAPVHRSYLRLRPVQLTTLAVRQRSIRRPFCARRGRAMVGRTAARLVILLPLAIGAAHAMQIDGRLDEPEWAQAQVFSDFRITEPFTRAAPKYASELRVLALPDALYV